MSLSASKSSTRFRSSCSGALSPQIQLRHLSHPITNNWDVSHLSGETPTGLYSMICLLCFFEHLYLHSFFCLPLERMIISFSALRGSPKCRTRWALHFLLFKPLRGQGYVIICAQGSSKWLACLVSCSVNWVSFRRPMESMAYRASAGAFSSSHFMQVP